MEKTGVLENLNSVIRLLPAFEPGRTRGPPPGEKSLDSGEVFFDQAPRSGACRSGRVLGSFILDMMEEVQAESVEFCLGHLERHTVELPDLRNDFVQLATRLVPGREELAVIVDQHVEAK